MNSAVAVDDWALPVPRPVTPSTILAEELGEVCRLLQRAGVDPALLVRLSRACDLAAGLDRYLDECTTPESPALAALARRTRETDWDAQPSSTGLEQEMLSGHVEGQLLKFLVHIASASRVLEIGMFTGYSALAMAEALPDDGVVVACEVDPGVARFARECFDVSPAGPARGEHDLDLLAIASVDHAAGRDLTLHGPLAMVLGPAGLLGALPALRRLLALGPWLRLGRFLRVRIRGLRLVRLCRGLGARPTAPPSSAALALGRVASVGGGSLAHRRDSRREDSPRRT